MSLLEDVFLEDEAGEAQELERVIEGDEFDERPRYESDNDSNDNSEKEDEAEEDKRRVDPATTKTKKVVKNPRFILNPARLTGPRGIHVIPDHFKDFKFKGKGHEKEDLDMVLKKLEHWAYRLYPKFKFDDCLKKIETLGKKRPVMVHLQKIRSDQLISEETVVQRDSSDDEAPPVAPEEDEFDKLLQQQIELARSTPAPNSVKKPAFTPTVDNRSPLTMPKAISSPSISDEQKERIIRNRKLAEERRLARLKNNSTSIDLTTGNVMNEVPIEVDNHLEKDGTEFNKNQFIDLTNSNTTTTVVNEFPIIVENHTPIDIDEPKARKQNRSNIIDSSDDECEEVAVNQSITVDVHNVVHNDVEMCSPREKDGNIDSNDIDNDLDIEDLSKQVAESNSKKSDNVIKYSVNDETNTNENDISKEGNSTSKEIIANDTRHENNALDKSVNEITENISNVTEAVSTKNVINKSSDEDENFDNDGVIIETSTTKACNAHMQNRNYPTEFNISENVIHKNNANNDFDKVKMNIENSIVKDSNEPIVNINDSTQSNRTENVVNESNVFVNANKEINLENDASSYVHINNDSVHDDSNIEISHKNQDDKEHIDSTLDNKNNIDNNIELDLMDVDFGEDF